MQTIKLSIFLFITQLVCSKNRHLMPAPFICLPNVLPPPDLYPRADGRAIPTVLCDCNRTSEDKRRQCTLYRPRTVERELAES